MLSSSPPLHLSLVLQFTLIFFFLFSKIFNVYVTSFQSASTYDPAPDLLGILQTANEHASSRIAYTNR